MNTTTTRLPPLGQILQRCALALALALVCAGCESLPQTVKVDFAEPKATQPIAHAPAADRSNPGSLFQKVSYRPAFEDPRARAVGDIITILIVETVTASQVSKSTANRTTSGSASVSAFPLLSAIDLANLKAGVGTASASDFSGKGGTESANTFTGSITATVVDVLPNGHLVVTGEKQIGVNQNVDVLRFSGTIDPRLVQPGNIVNSTQVANARIESKGRGAQAEAQTVGWLTRFFFSFLPF
ncbi:flagellar basal body L-ring protein FlgH [Rhodoferax ferrireducens]|uniref:flagellar basal body L-ring protein FlgH n=1 Tax=Rhodoferax ferrireducens TaxID=192843 RepID=UPI000E0D11A9|nr:flagellar basal body L-ring protein FlgH [Rhodoferax ferrireducens]